MPARATISILALMLSAPASAGDTAHWVRFGNARFGTIAEIPEGLFKARQPPANGDGRGFQSKDGAELRIYGSLNHEKSFAAHEASLIGDAASDGIKVTYKAGGASWLVYSGYQGNNVVYHKQVEGCGGLHSVYAIYPRTLKAKYDPIISRIAGALRCVTPAWDCSKGKGQCISNVPEYRDGIEWPE